MEIITKRYLQFLEITINDSLLKELGEQRVTCNKKIDYR